MVFIYFLRQKNVYSVYQNNPKQVGFAKLSDAALQQNSGDLAVPSATVGSAATVSATSRTSGTGSGSSNGVMSMLRIPSTLVLSSLIGGVVAVCGAL